MSIIHLFFSVYSSFRLRQSEDGKDVYESREIERNKYLQIINEVNRMGVLICLDPGHGGSDQGAAGISLLEKDVCLDIADRVERKLADYEDIQVIMTRSGDVEVSMDARSDWANRKNADLYVSFHTNFSVDPSDSGFASYVSVFAGSKTRCIQRCLHNQIAYFLRQVGVLDLGKKNDTESMTGSLEELRRVHMPAIALGSLFITNDKEHHLLNDHQFLDQYANCVTESIAMIFQRSKKKAKRSEKVVDLL